MRKMLVIIGVCLAAAGCGTSPKTESGVIVPGKQNPVPCRHLSSATITGYRGANPTVTIPSRFKNKPVTRIKPGAFSNRTLTAINVDPTNTAFFSVEGVVFDKTGKTLVAYPTGKSGSPIIPPYVTRIGADAFAGCTNLKEITLLRGITRIGADAFRNGTSLTGITLPEGITHIEAYAFAGCTGLTRVSFPDSLKRIEKNAFAGCDNLKADSISLFHKTKVAKDAFPRDPRFNIRYSASKQPDVSSGGIRAVNPRVPQFIKDAIRSAPQDVLIGIRVAKMATLSMSRVIAATRARAEISRSMNSMVRDMVRDYTAASEVDPDAAISFQEVMTVSLRNQGAGAIAEDMDDEGNYWVVVQLSKTATLAEINQSCAAAKLRVPAAASFDPEARIDEAFARQMDTEIGYRDSDY